VQDATATDGRIGWVWDGLAILRRCLEEDAARTRPPFEFFPFFALASVSTLQTNIYCCFFDNLTNISGIKTV